ncbi:MAG: PKD domain-containing protein [Thermoplasmatota archaeon]
MKKRGLLLAFILLAPCLTAGATAAAGATVTLTAPSMVVTGQQVTVTVSVAGLQDFHAANYSLTYNQELLELDMVEPGLVDGTEIPVLYNDVSGELHVVNTLNTSTVNGSGYLARVTFTALSSGTDSLSIEGNLSGIQDEQQIEIPATWQGTSITTTSTVLEVTAPGSVNDTFTATLAISNVNHLDSFNLNLSYNTYVLGVQKYTNGSIAGTPISVAGNVQKDIGVLTLVGVTPDGAASGSGILATITFIPKSTGGTSPLTITDAVFAAADNGSAIPVYLKNTSVVVESETDVPPIASFTWQPPDPVTSDTIVFSAEDSRDSDGWITQYAWDFGDDDTAAGADLSQVNHQFSSPGTYTVSLTVTDNDGFTNTSIDTIEVNNAPPAAAFSFSPAQPYEGQLVSFTDESSDPDGTITSRQWQFGDGTSSNQANPTHTYGSDGTYTVTLTVTDEQGADDTVTDSITVAANTPPGTPSQPSGPANGETSRSYSYTTGASDPEGHAIRYRFDWGDGATTGWQPSASASHAWSSAGTYSVRVQAQDEFGAESDWSTSRQVTIEQASPPPPPPPPEPEPPLADFSYGIDGLTVSFTDESSDPDGTVTSWAWQLGDGTSSSQASPSHTYGSEGTYTVMLTVTDDDGMTDTTSMDITVTTSEPQQPDLLVIDIVMTPASPAEGDTIQVTVTIANLGPVHANQTPLDLFLDGEWITSILLPALEAGGEVDRTQVINATPGSHTLTATVDPDDALPETNEANNEQTMQFSVSRGDDGEDDGIPWSIMGIGGAIAGAGAIVFVWYRRRMPP